jgi:hypothetical protein
VIWFGKRLVVPVDPEIRKTIFDEAHMSKFSIHPGSKDVSRLEAKILVVQYES